MKINTFPIIKLRQAELYGYYNEVRWQIKTIFGSVPEWAEKFLESVDNLDESLSPKEDKASTKLLDKADKEADDAWGGANAFFRAMARHPDPAVREAGEYCLSVFARYENPTAKGYASAYAQMERLITALYNIPQAYRDKIGADPWIDHLKACCDRFSNLYRDRVQSISERPVGSSTQSRKDSIAVYKKMIEHINALLLVSPSGNLEQLAIRINKLIDQNVVNIKSRKTAAGNKDDEEEKSEE